MDFRNTPKTRQDVIDQLLERDSSADVNERIIITFEKTDYSVDRIDAYDLDKAIELPDGRIIEVRGWFETNPPSPMGYAVLSGRTEGFIVTKAVLA